MQIVTVQRDRPAREHRAGVITCRRIPLERRGTLREYCDGRSKVDERPLTAYEFEVLDANGDR